MFVAYIIHIGIESQLMNMVQLQGLYLGKNTERRWRMLIHVVMNTVFKLIKYSHYISLIYPPTDRGICETSLSTNANPSNDFQRYFRKRTPSSDIRIFKCSPIDQFRYQKQANFNQLEPLLGTSQWIAFKESG